MKIALVLFDIDLSLINLSDYYLIGVDKGALNLVKNNYKVDLAIGDFDSVSKKEFNLIKGNSKELIVLNPIKDKTDTEEALDYALKKSSDITIFGGIIGKRIEHFLSNLTLFYKFNDLKIVDNNSLILYKDKISLNKEDYKEYKYVSFFTLTNTTLTLKGFKYNLDNFALSLENCSLTTSNEILSDIASVISSNKVLIVFSKSDKSIEK